MESACGVSFTSRSHILNQCAQTFCVTKYLSLIIKALVLYMLALLQTGAWCLQKQV